MTRRILHLIPTLGGGGAERQLVYITRSQVLRGDRVHVGHVVDGYHLQSLVEAGVTAHKFKVASNVDPRLFGRVLALVRKVRPDIVQTHLTQMDVVGGTVARLLGVPWVLSERASGPFYRGGARNVARSLITRGAAAIEANSIAGIHYWARQCPGVLSRFIPCGLPFDEFADAAPLPLADLRRSAATRIVLVAGRLDPQKNLEALLPALQTVVTTTDTVVVLAGEGPLEGWVRTRIEELGISDRVHLPGYLKDLWSWMKSVDIFVSISHFEGRPNTVLEAAACCCPLVISDIPEHREFLDERSAFFVDRNSSDQVGRAILEALEDRETAIQHAQAALTIVSRFSIEAMTDDLSKLYDEVVR